MRRGRLGSSSPLAPAYPIGGNVNSPAWVIPAGCPGPPRRLQAAAAGSWRGAGSTTLGERPPRKFTGEPQAHLTCTRVNDAGPLGCRHPPMLLPADVDRPGGRWRCRPSRTQPPTECDPSRQKRWNHWRPGQARRGIPLSPAGPETGSPEPRCRPSGPPAVLRYWRGGQGVPPRRPPAPPSRVARVCPCRLARAGPPG